MSDDAEILHQKIVALEQTIATNPILKDLLQPQLHDLRSQLTITLGAGSSVSDTNIAVGNQGISLQSTGYGPQVGINLGTLIFGRSPIEEERYRLVRYLERVAYVYGRLSLRGFTVERQQGFDSVDLNHIYIKLGTELLVPFDRGAESILADRVERSDQGYTPLQRHDPAWVLPDQAILRIQPPHEPSCDIGENLGFFSQIKPGFLPTTPNADEWILWRSELASEVLDSKPHVVFLGDPGSGKSVLLRRYASHIAEQSLGDTATPQLPLLISARKIAERLFGINQLSWNTTLVELLASEAERTLTCDPITEVIKAALHSHALILLIDGLDEVPRAATEHTLGRSGVIDVLLNFANGYPFVRMALTCRTRAFDAGLRERLRWTERTLAPFTIGQIRAFLRGWYAAFQSAGLITNDQVDDFQAKLLDAILLDEQNQQPYATISLRRGLRVMATSPLLLTLMAQVLYADGLLPRDRPGLYERMMDLLLGVWDSVRDEQSRTFGQIVGLVDWSSRDIRPFLHQIAYEAHRDTTSQDGRGRLPKAALMQRLSQFFEKAQAPEPWAAAGRCAEYFEQRSGLLVPDGPDNYVLAHLTFQEHCAGQYLVEAKNPVEMILSHRHDDRWREAILLGLGVMQEKNIHLFNSVLQCLLREKIGNQPKNPAVWHRDLLLAAEIGADRGWDRLRRTALDVPLLQADLRRGLVDVLEHPSLDYELRIRAGQHLSQLDDPRFPVTLDEWVESLANLSHTFTQTGSHYWRYVPAGRYTIGGWEPDQPAVEVDLKAFWVARFPITVGQFALYSETKRRRAICFSTQQANPSQSIAKYPASDSPKLHQTFLNHQNIPLSISGWDEINTFCRWLTACLAIQLPAATKVRLPSEAEWEVMASWDGVKRRHYPWGDAEPTPYHSRFQVDPKQVFRDPPVVGMFPMGIAASGVLDVAGSIKEWTISPWQGYPLQATYAIQRGSNLINTLRGNSNYCSTRHEGLRFKSEEDQLKILWITISHGLRVVIGEELESVP